MTATTSLIHASSPIADNPFAALRKHDKHVQFSLPSTDAEANRQAKTGAALGQVKPVASVPGRGNLLNASLINEIGG
jgi:hypothetical protein